MTSDARGTVHCAICGQALDCLAADTVHVCADCLPRVNELALAGRSLIVSAARKRLSTASPRLFATMQQLWKLATAGPNHE
jgi:hypothetical protein